MLFSNCILPDLVIFAFSLAVAKLVLDRRSSQLATLRGPRSNNIFLGKLLEVLDDPATAVDRWVSEYGYVFKVPTGLGTNAIVITDPKAVAHVFANDSFGYLRPTLEKKFMTNVIGHSMVSADGEDHRRQRRATAPAFTNGALRGTIDVFYDSAYKLKGAWDVLFESHDEVTIDVQQWINKVTLDSMGIAGFGHDFRCLDGHKSPVSEALDGFLEDNSFIALFLFAVFFPQVFKLPLKPTKIRRRMKKAMSDIAKVLLENSQQEKDLSNVEKDRSILGLLCKDFLNFPASHSRDSPFHFSVVKARSQNTNFKLLQDEAVGQIVRSFQLHICHVLTTHRLPGLFPTCRSEHDLFFVVSALITVLKDITQPQSFCMSDFSSTLAVAHTMEKWALVELARHPEKQDKLRRELLQFSGSNPTWDHVVTGTACPYLDAVVQESLRLHPPIESLDRIAAKDDVVPLSTPMKTSSGKMVDTLFVPKGTTVTIPLIHINRSEAFWGPNAKQFVPERWLEENPYPSKDFSGYRHLSFSDGPRICLGRVFALAEFKAVLSVLIRNFVFELPSGPDTAIGSYKSFLPRPKLADEAGCVLRMRVRRSAAAMPWDLVARDA
ncbi:Cytochrome P450 [Amanita muscaria]